MKLINKDKYKKDKGLFENLRPKTKRFNKLNKIKKFMDSDEFTNMKTVRMKPIIDKESFDRIKPKSSKKKYQYHLR